LIALAQDEADLAGTHLWDESTDTYNLPFVKRVLPGRRLVLLTLAHRQLGLILPPGNPGEIKNLQDLAQPEIRFINRQPGSGSRVWLDAQLKMLGVEPNTIEGFDREETTHLGLANAIAQGEATAGLGIHAAASSLGLEFVPLTKEQYDLVIPEHLWNLPQTQALVKIVRSSHFKEAVNSLGGYDLSESGRETRSS
jgi:putative molybdopterin biosynthesis protein